MLLAGSKILQPDLSVAPRLVLVSQAGELLPVQVTPPAGSFLGLVKSREHLPMLDR